jgi:hypothetical protein
MWLTPPQFNAGMQQLTNALNGNHQALLKQLGIQESTLQQILGQQKSETDALLQLVAVLKSILGVSQQILALVEKIQVQSEPPVALSIAFVSELRRRNQVLQLPLNKTDYKEYIIGTDKDGLDGAQLAPGQTIAVVSSDPTIVDFATPDTPPQADNEGVASVWSAGVVPKAVGGPVTCTATVSNADGTVAETATGQVTVTPAVPGVATAIGEVFEESVAGVVAKPSA